MTIPPILTGVADLLLRLRFANTAASSSLTFSRFSWLPMVIPATLIGFLERLNPLILSLSGGSEPDLTMVLAGDDTDDSDAG